MDYVYRGGKIYADVDFVSRTATRSPREYPYSFDAYFTWRPDPVEDADCTTVYSDRMRGWDNKKFKAAFADNGTTEGRKPNQARRVIDIYYDGKYECVGYAVACNQSSGYPIGVFYIKEKK